MITLGDAAEKPYLLPLTTVTGLQFYESGKHLFASSDGAGPLAIAASGGLCGLLSWVLVRIAFLLPSILLINRETLTL